MSWEKVKLGDIVEFSNGVNFGKQDYTKGVKLISVSSFSDYYYPEYNDLEEISEDVVKQKDFLQTGDIVFVRSNGNKELVGRCMLIENPPTSVTFSGFCIRVRFKDLKKNDPRFWTYHFKSFKFRQAMSGTAVGTNIQNLSQGRMKVYETTIPDILVQRKIAGVLLTYDNLIENNKKQIKLLEEMAQRLYKEWFVDLHFPGYEDVEIVNSVPEGWSKDNIGALIRKVTRTKQIKVTDYKREGKIPIIDQSKEFIAGYTDDVETLISVSEPIIVFGDHTRILKLIQFSFAKGADGTQLIVSNCDRMPQRLLYCSLINIDLSNHHYARHFKYLKAEEVMVPTVEIAEKFETILVDVFKQVQNCRYRMEQAIEARNKLLSRLICGDLVV